MTFTDRCQWSNVERNVTRRCYTGVCVHFFGIVSQWVKRFSLPRSVIGLQGDRGWSAGEKGGGDGKKNKNTVYVADWCYFEKQTRGEMSHHVRHVVCWVATQAGRCEGQLDVEKVASWVSQQTERVMKLDQEEQRQV